MTQVAAVIEANWQSHRPRFVAASEHGGLVTDAQTNLSAWMS
jgi:hypothetical protein